MAKAKAELAEALTLLANNLILLRADIALLTEALRLNTAQMETLHGQALRAEEAAREAKPAKKTT